MRQVTVDPGRMTARAEARALWQDVTDAAAGYDLVSLGGLGKARVVEGLAWLLVAAVKDGVPVCCRFAVPGGLCTSGIGRRA